MGRRGRRPYSDGGVGPTDTRTQPTPDAEMGRRGRRPYPPHAHAKPWAWHPARPSVLPWTPNAERIPQGVRPGKDSGPSGLEVWSDMSGQNGAQSMPYRGDISMVGGGSGDLPCGNTLAWGQGWADGGVGPTDARTQPTLDAEMGRRGRRPYPPCLRMAVGMAPGTGCYSLPHLSHGVSMLTWVWPRAARRQRRMTWRCIGRGAIG